MEKNYLTEQYDHTDFYAEQMKPLADKLWELAESRGIPFVLCACIKVGEDAHTMARSTHLNGPERTPVELVAAEEILSSKTPSEVLRNCLISAQEVAKVFATGCVYDGDPEAEAESATKH